MLLAAAALAAILIACTVTIGTGQISLADTVDRNNGGIDLRTNTEQAQVCKTTGNNSPITAGSCTAGSSNTIAQNGRETMATTEEGATKKFFSVSWYSSYPSSRSRLALSKRTVAAL